MRRLAPGTILTPEGYIGPPVFYHTSLVLDTNPKGAALEALCLDWMGQLELENWMLTTEPHISRLDLGSCEPNQFEKRSTAADLGNTATEPDYEAIVQHAYERRGNRPFASLEGHTEEQTRLDAALLKDLVLLIGVTAFESTRDGTIKACETFLGYLQAVSETACTSLAGRDVPNIMKRAEYFLQRVLHQPHGPYPGSADRGIFCSIVIIYIWQSALWIFFGNGGSTRNRAAFVLDVLPVAGRFCSPRGLRNILAKNTKFWRTSPIYGCHLTRVPSSLPPNVNASVEAAKRHLMFASTSEQLFPLETGIQAGAPRDHASGAQSQRKHGAGETEGGAEGSASKRARVAEEQTSARQPAWDDGKQGSALHAAHYSVMGRHSPLLP